MNKTICVNKCDTHGPVKECDTCKSMYCTDCFTYDCPKCMDDLGNKIISRTGKVVNNALVNLVY